MSKIKKHKKWTEKEIDFVVKNYRGMNSQEIAKNLNRTQGAINQIKYKLRLKEQENWSRHKIKKHLKDIYKQLKHSPTSREVPQKLYQACLRYFGSFNKAKTSVKLQINKTKYNKIKKNSNNLSKELAYVIGVAKGDGHTYIRRNKHGTSAGIILKVKDKDFAEYFKNTLENWSGIKTSFHFYPKNYFVTNLSSIEAAKIIKNFKINKILVTNKSKKCAFLQGLYDSEGGVIGINLHNRKNAKRWITFSNNNKPLINIVKSILSELNIKHKLKSRVHSGFGSKKIQYELNIYDFNSILKFYKNINFNIARKRNKLEEVLNSYNFYKNNLIENTNLWR
ncbi:MAG: LAGLIDADG family homing endonuclease [archaeon]